MNMPNENMINDLPHDNEVESRARAVFRNACESTDSYHALRLGLARRKALQSRVSHSPARLWAPLAGGAAACCALVIGVMLMRPDVRTAAPDTTIAASAPIVTESVESTEDIPVVASNQMEMVQDLDFYRWLAAQPSVASATPKNVR
ncbi:MAG: hypothetical protein OJF55_000622 [Rhodanobacteraceae bacterium]|jgi:hypothetical protein|nr:MAG: hypothetical protein OJF55_000622 [Rhodanobacteraceae bacterium]